MSRILLIGYPPPHLLIDAKAEAANYRTWQFIQPLLGAGHSISFCVIPSHLHVDVSSLPPNFELHTIPFESIGWAGRLQAVYNAFLPDCVVAVAGLLPSLYATRLRTSKPMWMDMYGDPLTIYQVARYREGKNRGIGTGVAWMREALLRGDVFSTCGVPQQHMLVGELAMCGRLNARTFGYDFARVIYPGANPSLVDAIGKVRERETMKTLGIGSDDFVVLWCGGYNTWTDVATLYKGLALAMDECPRLHFVSVGASAYSAAEGLYNEFVQMVRESRHSVRFHLLGWRPYQEMAGYYRESDVGISIDSLHYETIYGTRTRLVEMMAHGLPVITTEGCELADMISHRQAGSKFPIGDPRALTRCVLELATSDVGLEGMRKAALDLASGDLSFESTAAPLLTWARSPVLAPDNVQVRFTEGIATQVQGILTAGRVLIWRFSGISGNRF